MIASIGSHEAETQLPALLERVARGESITITEHGRPVARLVPAGPETGPVVEEAVRSMLEYRDRSGPLLGKGPSIRDLIEEGRRY